ncbi:MAG: hypothetical protein ACYC1C_00750 [Chloroflexota bacterium]
MAYTDGDPLDGAVERYLRYLDERSTPPPLEGLSDREREETSAIFRLFDACWGIEAMNPLPLDQDPIAIRLGSVGSVEDKVQLSGAAIRSARQRQRLTLRQVLAALKARGFELEAPWLFGVEQAPSIEVDGKLADELARVLGVQAQSLTSGDLPRKGNSLDLFLSSLRFSSLVEEWARRRGRDPEKTKQTVSRQLVGAAFRSHGEPSSAEWSQLVVEVLESLED